MVSVTDQSHKARMKREGAQMSALANVLMMWANVELIMEMWVQKKLNLTLEQTCIMCGPLGGGAKFNMFASLFADDEDRQDLIQAIRNFQTVAGRNAIAHGFITFTHRDQPWVLVSREVKNKLTIKHRTITDYFKDDFMPAWEKINEASGFADADIHEYGLAIARLQLDEASKAHRPPE